MPVLAHNTTLKIGGTPTAFTNEPTTKVTANTVYQITDTTKRIVDPAASVTVEVDADGAGGGGYVTAAPDTYDFDFVFGKVTFVADQGASALVRVSGNYIPTLTVAGARECTVKDTSELADKTAFGDAGRRRMVTLQDFNGSIGGIEPLTTDHDPGAGTKKFRTLQRAGTPVLIEYRPGGSGNYFRGWIILENGEEKAQVASLLETTLNFQALLITGANQTEGAVSGWGT